VAKRFLLTSVVRQGDQIGRIFASWATFFIGQFCENYRRVQVFGAYSCIHFDKKRFVLLFGQFFHKLLWSPWLCHLCPSSVCKAGYFLETVSFNPFYCHHKKQDAQAEH
jgi:hypothetical protein